MSTESRAFTGKIGTLLLGLQLALPAFGQVPAFPPVSPGTPKDAGWEQALVLDVELGVLQGPVLQPFQTPGGPERGLPRWPIYKQEPLGALTELPGDETTSAPVPDSTAPTTSPAPRIEDSDPDPSPPEDGPEESGDGGDDDLELIPIPVEIIPPPDDGGIEQDPTG